MIRLKPQVYALLPLILATTAKCQVPQPATSAQQPPSLPVVSQMKKSVVFLETDCLETRPDGTAVINAYAGTAFLLSVKDTRPGTQGQFLYLVTNRHVAEPGSESGHPCKVTARTVRVDKKVPNAAGAYSVVESLPAAMPWTFSKDASVDLAVVPFGMNPIELDVLFLPFEMLLGTEDAEKNQVVEGDSVLFTGLFVQLVGQTHSEPIVREGRIAMMPREQTPTTLRELGDVYLVDCHVFGGNSGSPMFVNLAGQRDSGLSVGFNYRLLGVVSGYVQEAVDFTLKPVAAFAGTVTANSGIAVVVPAQKLIDIINSPKLKLSRDQEMIGYPAATPKTTPHP